MQSIETQSFATSRERPKTKIDLTEILASTEVHTLPNGMMYIGNGLKIKPNLDQDITLRTDPKGRPRHSFTFKNQPLNSYLQRQESQRYSYSLVDFTPTLDEQVFQHNTGDMKQKNQIMYESLRSALKLIDLLEKKELDTECFWGIPTKTWKNLPSKSASPNSVVWVFSLVAKPCSPTNPKSRLFFELSNVGYKNPKAVRR